jgi:undecaprenyl diphosphate synthase
MKSSFEGRKPLHVAIIMDGNGRWAAARGWPRTAGHRAGADSVRRVVEAAPGLGIRTLTLYAFSSDNWKRPASETATLMNMFQSYLQKETPRCVENGIRVSVIGRRDRLSLALCAAIEATENATAGGRNLHVRVAVDYSSRDAILDAVRRARCLPEISREVFTQLLVGDIRNSPELAEVDLLIRTGGEQRLSDFLLWECAYAELYFTPVMWPDFTAADLEEAVAEYYRRERRFGGIPAQSVAS